MRLTVCVVLLGLLSAANTEAQPQRTDVCVNGIADAYRFRPVPFTQNEIRVTTNTNNPGFFRGGPHPSDRCSSQLRWNPGS